MTAGAGREPSAVFDVVVDTNVVVAVLAGETQEHEAAMDSLRRAGAIHAPDHLRAELLSSLWQLVRFAGLAPDDARAMLREAEAMVDTFHPIEDLLEAALTLAVERRQSPYDTLFVALAGNLARSAPERPAATVRVLTFDRKLLQRFPEWCVEPRSEAR